MKPSDYYDDSDRVRYIQFYISMITSYYHMNHIVAKNEVKKHLNFEFADGREAIRVLKNHSIHKWSATYLRNVHSVHFGEVKM